MSYQQHSRCKGDNKAQALDRLLKAKAKAIKRKHSMTSDSFWSLYDGPIAVVIEEPDPLGAQEILTVAHIQGIQGKSHQCKN